MSALVLKAHLERLMLRHSLELTTPPELPLVASTDHALIFEGLASSGDRDAEFCVFAPHAFGDLSELPPLLLGHDHDHPAGNIERLSYDNKGQLLIRAYVDDAEARRRSAFSVGCRVRQFELCDVDSPSRFHAFIKQAVLTDVSVVSRPVNNRARVLKRERPSPASSFVAGKRRYYDLEIARVTLIQKMLREMVHA